MGLQLTIKKPGSLLSVLLKMDINEQQYAAIVLLLARPDDYRVTKKPGLGFQAPAERTTNVGS